MIHIIAAFLTFLALAAPLPAGAHPLKELEGQLYEREKFFQPLRRKAPAFQLQDAQGRSVSLVVW